MRGTLTGTGDVNGDGGPLIDLYQQDFLPSRRSTLIFSDMVGSFSVRLLSNVISCAKTIKYIWLNYLNRPVHEKDMYSTSNRENLRIRWISTS